MSAALPKYPDPAWLTKCTMCQGFRSVLILCKGTNDKKNNTNNKDRWYEICLDNNENFAGTCRGFRWRDDIPRGRRAKVIPPGKTRAPLTPCPGHVCNGKGWVHQDCICGVCKKDCKVLLADRGFRASCRASDHVEEAVAGPEPEPATATATGPGPRSVPRTPVPARGLYLSPTYDLQFDSIRSEQKQRDAITAQEQDRQRGRQISIFCWVQQGEKAEIVRATLTGKHFHPKNNTLVADIMNIREQRCYYFDALEREWVNIDMSAPDILIQHVQQVHLRKLGVTEGRATAGSLMPSDNQPVEALIAQLGLGPGAESGSVPSTPSRKRQGL
ncbi:hypothetical protein EXIGLDRAFT_779092 [Exidia glandulosa HHB12029]|uniref:Uncharacterized protein n=1 Tax=Exidia glandulosa HHB12029 TaxID=1314781 RepID=A0A165C7Y3_EXIGL|nr:hypothetical protein EXIGLDRAFT_779092 [Exidia glandulosa HHB12029]